MSSHWSFSMVIWSLVLLSLICLVAEIDAFAVIQHSVSIPAASSSSAAAAAFVTHLSTNARTTRRIHDNERCELRRWTSSTEMRMVSYEQLMEKLPSNDVIAAVEAAPDRKVIASDVAASAGVSLSQARKDLTALASLTLGDIAVSKDGELIYSFPPNINSVLSSRSAKFKAQETFRKVWPGIFWFIRVSFGVTLIVSLLAIYSTIFFISSSSSSDDDRDNNRGGGGGGLSFGYSPFWGPSPFDFFYYRPYGSYGMYSQPDREPEEMGFFESVFSYIFGDGNPNEGKEEKRLSLAAQMIRDNQGSVTAEQLAPYCDDAPPPKGEESSYVDESFVLPIVTQLNGEPRVTDTGDIVYIFPDLQMSASSSSTALSEAAAESATKRLILRRAGLRSDATARQIKQVLNRNMIDTRGALERDDLIRILEKYVPPLNEEEQQELRLADPSMLREREYKFSLAPDFNKFLAGGLGVVNLGGALYLGNLLGQYALYGVQLPSYFGVVQSLYPFLLTYAVLFNVIPLVRNFWINSQNGKIRERNNRRMEWKTALSLAMSNSSSRIRQKLKAADRMRMKMKQLGGKSDEILYDTTTPIEKLEQKKEQDDLDEFDKLLGN